MSLCATLDGVLNESYPPPRFFLIFLAAVSVVMLSGCAITKSLPDSLEKREYGEAKDWIEKGVDVNAVDELKNTPLCYSSARYDHYCNEAGYGHVYINKQKLFRCEGTFEEQLNIVTLLIRKGAKVNSACGTLGNPLLAAIHYNNMDAVRILISNGADVNKPTLVKLERGASLGGGLLGLLQEMYSPMPNDGKTPLMHAYSFGYTEIAQLLLKNGADPSIRTKAGKTAKDYYNAYLEQKRIEDAELARRQQAAYEQRQRDRAESREMWGAVATLGTGVAVGHATRNLAPDQQERMMRSSMQGVQSGDMSEFNATTQQVKAERTQEHNAKMQAIEAQKEREGYDAKEAEAANNRRMMDASIRSHQPSVQNTTNRQQPSVQPWNNQANRSANSNANSSRNAGNTQIASNQNGVRADSSSDNENWKSAFKFSRSDCDKRAKVLQGSCEHSDIFKPAFTAADSSAAEQSKLCSEAKNRALTNNTAEDLGCGCGLLSGNLSCTYFTVSKSRYKGGSGGKSK